MATENHLPIIAYDKDFEAIEEYVTPKRFLETSGVPKLRNIKIRIERGEEEMMEEEELVERVASRIESRIEERIKYSVVRSIVDALEEEFYPPEEMFRDEFVKRVEEAEKEGGRVFKDREELKEYLERLAEPDAAEPDAA